VAALALVLWALPPFIRFVPHAPLDFWLMAALAVLIDLPLFQTRGPAAILIRPILSPCFAFAIFLLWGAAQGIVVEAVAVVVTALGQRYGIVAGIFLTARHICALAVAQAVVLLVFPRHALPPTDGLIGRDLVPTLLLASAWFVATFALLLQAGAAVRRSALHTSAREVRGELLATSAAVLLTVPLLAGISGWWVLFVAIPLLALNQRARDQLRWEDRMSREPVTGLLNRQGLTTGLDAVTLFDPIRPESPRPVGMVLVNVDSALGVKHSLGRDVYESLLTEAAHRLGATFGTDRVGRLYGEGFLLIFPGLTDPDALTVAGQVVRVLEPVIVIGDIPLRLEPVAGVALSPDHGRDFDTLVVKAELAVGEARRFGKTAMVYVKQTQDDARRRTGLLAELHTVLRDPRRHKEITVVYQPQIELSTGRLVAAEALVRWTHPDWGPVRPDELLAAVEPTEVMHLLTRHVLDLVGTQMCAWNRRGLRLRVSVNISAQDLHDPNFPEEISEVLRLHKLPAQQLTIEITERMLIADAERVVRAVAPLTALGVGLSLDDFGTGYASMQQLQLLPLTEVKIDKSYVAGITDNPARRAIVTSVHELASALGLTVVAEGVEEERTADALRRLSGTIGQGYHFGRPVPPEEFERQWHRPVSERPAPVRGWRA
jgi:diguanylate cyclase (GGDEF)-like protein